MAEFDVFLSHNSKDKPAVRQLAQLLKERRIRVWLDEDQLIPGRNWQSLLEQGIESSATGAVLVGKDGLGPWENEELQALLSQAVSAGKPIIPILLPDAPGKPKIPIFLRNRTWVDLRPKFTDKGIDLVIWGIKAETSVGPYSGFCDHLPNGKAAPSLVHIPAGSYLMGSPIGERGHRQDELQHEIQVGEFHIGRYPVTFHDFDLFCDAENLSKPFDHGWGTDNRPVIEVAFPTVMSYLAWLSRGTGEFYRLPTESEWEYAARAGTQTRYWWGESVTQDEGPWANCRGCDDAGGKGKTSRADAFPANPWGLHDMAGNVWEMTSSLYHKAYSGAESRPAHLDNSGARVMRGGSWMNGPLEIRSARRQTYSIADKRATLGFRVVRQL